MREGGGGGRRVVPLITFCPVLQKERVGRLFIYLFIHLLFWFRDGVHVCFGHKRLPAKRFNCIKFKKLCLGQQFPPKQNWVMVVTR